MERVSASILLVALAPTLILIGFLLRANTDEPVLVTDELLRTDGTKLRVHRFRTTGRGTPLFRFIGRFLRFFGIDDVPAVWDVVRGQIGFRNPAQLNRKS
jgi:lipopolysaccharide/colanic/teichoic acid biosynthesis glycosyltransferase